MKTCVCRFCSHRPIPAHSSHCPNCGEESPSPTAITRVIGLLNVALIIAVVAGVLLFVYANGIGHR